MMKVRLTKEEVAALTEAAQASRLEDLIDLEADEKENIYLCVSEDAATELRESCSDLLSTMGFDEDYRPNEKGVVLENLIDKLYVP